MKTHLIIVRPASLSDLADALDRPIMSLQGLVRRHRIAPAIRINRTGFYGPREIKRICALADSE